MYDSMIYQFQHSFHSGSVETPKPSELTRKQKVTRHSIGNKKMSWASAHGHSQHKQQKSRVSSYTEEVLEWVAIPCKYPLWMQSQLPGSTELTCIVTLPVLLYNLTMHDNLQNSTIASSVYVGCITAIAIQQGIAAIQCQNQMSSAPRKIFIHAFKLQFPRKVNQWQKFAQLCLNDLATGNVHMCKDK